MRADVRAAVLSALLVCWLLAGSVVFAAPAAAATIDVDHTIAQNDTQGQVDVKTRLRIPSGTASLEITIPENSNVYEMNGFTRESENTYTWTGTTNEPSLRYTLDANVTVTRNGEEQYTYAVTDEWAIIRTPKVGLQWTGIQADVNRTQSAGSEGVAGRHITYLGSYAERSQSGSGQQFRLVVPAKAELRESPDDVLDSLTMAAKRLEIGTRDDQVLVIVAPTNSVEWAATGIQRGDADMWVRDVEQLDTARSAWVHEYVHSRQDYDRAEATQWTIEGMAVYYAALIPYEEGRIDYETFRRKMEQGTKDRYSDVQLTKPSTWRSNGGNYEKGALVFGYLDRRLRAESDTSIDAVIAELNEPDQELTQEEFLDAIEAAGNSDIRTDAKRYTETTDTPPLWSKEEHVEAFGGPDIRYSFDSFAVSGPYRQTTLDEPRFVAGETLETTVQVSNAGTQAGDFSAEFRVDGTAVETVSGTLEPGESTMVTVPHTFDSTGEYTLAVGTARTTAVIEEPADIEVTDLTVDPTNAALGETVRLRSTVESSADRPADGEVTFAVDGETVATRQVQLGTGQQVVEVTMSFETPGEHTVSAGDRTATVTVRDETATPTQSTEPNATPSDSSASATPTGGSGAGLGAAPATVALLATLVLFGFRKRP
ncbi:MAG: hypothetical protein ACI8UR_002399 [Natronomonas sp.]|jgi:hypothetical protein|uniref:CARDB domain-containing protein n=1 Tax=Natronomonas sp. TaxID=2184060 RepID=UPI0039E2F300